MEKPHPPTVVPSSAIELLDQMHELMKLKGENVFKVQAFKKASAAVANVSDLPARARAGTLQEIPGIGAGIARVLTDFLIHGKTPELDALAASLPPGLQELAQVPGVGPKKAMQLIEELGVHDLVSLEYACRENRLLKLKGFGEKLQNKIIAGIAFAKASQGQLRISDAFPLAEGALARLRALLADCPDLRVSEAGALRRRMEVVDGLDFLVELPARDADSFRTRLQREKGEGSLPLRLHFAPAQEFGYELARLTATEAHWKALGSPARSACPENCKTEADFYGSIGLPWIAPEMRETGEEIALARAGQLEHTLPWDGIQGVFHNHSTRSDGIATLEQMVQGARARGLKYFGISDHSQSAVYAQGLKGEDLLAQEKEVRGLQDKYPDIRIFWGIESDILADGSLDYDPKILKRFDFVVASVHSRFGMDRTTMTERVLEAVRNPYTTFLGHATGRLLLGRAGYELDMERVIAEAVAHHVAIEINANPVRLDIDWRWGSELRRRGTLVSVNPDAHEVEGLDDLKYGVAVARKALLPSGQVLNSRPVAEVEKWLGQK